MGNGELFEEMKRKDKEAQRQWIQRYGEDIARLAFQYGVTTNDANEIATKTFLQLFKKLSTIESETELWQRMYKIAIQKFNHYNETTINEFTFEEDEQLHKEIIQLPHMEKLAFILTTFTKMDPAKIARLLSITSEEVTRKNQEARMQLSDQQIDKRLALLQKSYHRIQFQIDEEQALNQDEINEEVFEQTSVKNSKRTVYMLVFGIVALIGITLYSVFNSEAYQHAATEKWIEKMKDTYEQQRVQAFIKLGLEEDDERLTRFNGLFGSHYLTHDENMHFQRFIKEVENDFEQNNPIDKKQITEEFDEIIDQMMTPNEMVEALFKKPLADDKEGSQAFLEKYLPKRYIVSTVYLESIYELINLDRYENEAITLADIFGNPNLMSDDIEEVIKKMQKQHLYIEYDDKEYLKEQDAFYQNLKASLHPDLVGYVTLLELSSYAYHWYSDDGGSATSEDIKEMEKTLLLQTSNDLETEQLLLGQYAYELLSFIKETDEQIYDEEGFVRQSIQEKWSAFIQEPDHPIATLIVEKIIEEFKATNWRYSENFIYLDPMSVSNILQYKKVNTGSFDWELAKTTNHQSIQLPNQGYENMVDEVYEQLEQKEAIEVLNGVNPLTTIGILLKAYENDAWDILGYIYASNVEQVSIEKDIEFFTIHEFSENDYLFVSQISREAGLSVGETDVRFGLMPEGDRWTIRSVDYQPWH